MCRHLGLLGPAHLAGPAHARGSRALLGSAPSAREMAWGEDNPDGWGFGWQDDDGLPDPYRSALPMTGDSHGRQMLGVDRVRPIHRPHPPEDAGLAHRPEQTAPFGTVTPASSPTTASCPTSATACANSCSGRSRRRDADAIQGDTDSEVLFALVLDRLDAGASPAEAVRAVADVGALYGGPLQRVVLGRRTRWSPLGGRTRCTCGTRTPAVDHLRALDDGPWREVPERTMVIVTDAGVRQENL